MADIVKNSTPPFFEVQGIRKSFGEHEVLRGIDFSMNRGEVLSIIGSSGSGKTTLLRCLNFLERADEGTVRIGGEEVFCAGQKYSDSELRERRLHFGLVFQQFNLFPQYNVLHNVTLALDLFSREELRLQGLRGKAYRRGVQEAQARNIDAAMALLRKTGLEEKASSYPCELSGGQQQRVAIARALMLSPEILCFDEPTSALDPELTGEVLRVIRDLRGGDRTMIIVTHEMEFARNVSDQIIFMADGVIEEQGTPGEVFGNPKSEKTRAFLRHATEK